MNSWHSEVVANYQFRTQTVAGEIDYPMANTLKKHEWDWLKDFFDADWFSRRWVIQEVVLSNNSIVLRGECTISWWVVGIAASILRTHYYHLHPEYTRMTGAHNAYLIFRLSRYGALKPINLKFIELFRLAAGFDTTDPRDKIFALLGIQTIDHDPKSRPLILPNYSIEQDDLDLTFVEALLQTSPPLAFLCGARRSSYHRGKSPPSWLPDFHSLARHFSSSCADILAPWSLDEQFNASKGLIFKGHLDQTRQHLLASGIHVSNILFCGSDWHSATEFYIKEVDELANLGIFTPTASTLSLLARTLTAGRTHYGGKQSDPNAFLAHFAALYASSETREILKLSTLNHPFPSTHAQSLISAARQLQEGGDPRTFCNAADQVSSKRVLFITTSGHVGLGPVLEPELGPGYQLCVLAGSPMPVILRAGEGEDYEFVGECYVDGIMDGEAVEAMRRGLSCEGPLGRVETIPIMEDYVDMHPEALNLVRSVQRQTLEVFREQMAVLKDVEFNIR